MSRRSRFLGGYMLRNGVFTPTLIRSIQRSTITITAGNLTNTATITAVNMNNSRLMYLGHITDDAGSGGTGSGPLIVSLTFTNSTTITADRTGIDGYVTVSFEVIEYFPTVLRTVQRSTVTATASTTGTATLSPTLSSVSKASLDFLGWHGSVGAGSPSYFAHIALTNTTTVTITRDTANNNLSANFQVCEWY